MHHQIQNLWRRGRGRISQRQAPTGKCKQSKNGKVPEINEKSRKHRKTTHIALIRDTNSTTFTKPNSRKKLSHLALSTVERPQYDACQTACLDLGWPLTSAVRRNQCRNRSQSVNRHTINDQQQSRLLRQSDSASTWSLCRSLTFL